MRHKRLVAGVLLLIELALFATIVLLMWNASIQ